MGIREQTRDMWGFPSMDALGQDLRYGARMLRRGPLFTIVAVGTLAIGIGASATVFSVADAVLFRPLAVTAPETLWELRMSAGAGIGRKDGAISASAFDELRLAADFASLVAFQSANPAAIARPGEDDGPSARPEIVSGNYFSVLAPGVAAGRLLGQNDTVRGAAPVAVLSERLWRSRFNRDPGIVGGSLTVNGTSVTVVGVASPRFGGMTIDRPAEIFLPMTLAHVVDGLPMAQGHLSVRVAVRLAEHSDPGVAADRLSALYAPMSPFGPGAPPPRLMLVPAWHGISDARPQLERPLLIVLGLVGVLLLIACANVGNLLLSRFASRQAEFAIRMAIGAGRRRVVQQLLVESLLISALAAAFALFVAMNAGALLVHLIPSRAPLALDLALDPRLIGFTAAIALLAALLVVAASAWRLASMDGAAVLREDSRIVAAGRRTLAHTLIVAQVACSLLLLVGAGSMLRTLWNLTHIDPGFTADRGFLVTVNAAGRVTDTARLPAYYESLRTRLARTPGVAAASLIQFPVMGEGATTGTVDVPGFIPVSDDDRWCRFFQVGPDFFASAGMSLLRGRGIEARDTAGGERVAVANESFARFYFGDVDPVGRVMSNNMRIVGIVRDARYDKLRDPAPRAVFVPYVQTRIRTGMTFVVRSAGGITLPDAVAAASAAVRDHDAALPFQVMTLPDQVMRTVSRERFLATLTATLSLLALVLACAGLYAMVAYSVSERRSEIGIRVALGARRADVIRLVLRQPVLTTAAGIAVGLPGAYLVMRTMASLLFGIRPFDGLTVGVSAAVLLAVAAAAALIPAYRAASTDPQDCLRCR